MHLLLDRETSVSGIEVLWVVLKMRNLRVTSSERVLSALKS
jgi:hypothetical protein